MKLQTVIVTNEDSDIRLDRFFKRHFPNTSFTEIAKAIRKKRIKLNGKSADINARISEGDEIKYPEFHTAEQEHVKRPPNFSKQAKEYEKYIFFQDENIIAINKPAGLAVQGGTKIRMSVDSLSKYWKFDSEYDPKLVHRIDKDTSGVLILARKPSVAAALSKLFRGRQIEKKYLAISVGVPNPKSGKFISKLEKLNMGGFERVKQSAGGKKAVTEYEVIDHAAKSYALLSLSIITGRTHQIRAQLSENKTPILGDDKYGKRTTIDKLAKSHLALHAYSMKFDLDGRRYELYAPLPDIFKESLKSLGLNDNTLIDN
jgi:23S rRNA pseudouridine955/2504/2580 synthase